MFNNIADVIQHSVTQNDTEGQYRKGAPGSVWNFFFPMGNEQSGYGILPPVLPLYWTQQRDRLLRSTVLKGGFWADAVGIACTKQASKGWDMKAEDAPMLVKRAQQLMLSLDGKGYVQGVQRGVRDFLTTDNGEFWEIVRASTAAGSRVLGLMHLDSLRCLRTGDDEIPLNYMDLKGRWHELQAHEVIMLCDMPSASAELFGVGLCAASRAYKAIFELDAITTYFNEKITGSKANSIHLVNGVSEKTLTSSIQSAEAQNNQQGYSVYKGVIVVPVYSENAVSGYEIQISGVPDKFDRKVETDLALLEFANAIGLDPQDLQPLSGQGLGTGAQSYVQAEKAKGKGLAARDKDFIQQVNDRFVPDAVTFYFKEIDLTDEMKQAEVSKVRADTRAVQIQSGEITAQQATNLAVEDDDLPQEYKIDTLQNINDTLGDEEKLDEIDPTPGVTPVPAQPTQPIAQPDPVTQPVVTKEYDALLSLSNEIKQARQELAQVEVAPIAPIVNVAPTDFSPVLKSIESLLNRDTLNVMAQPPITINNNMPRIRKEIQTVHRGSDGLIASTTTEYEYEE